VIRGEHCVIRTADVDDAQVLKRLYDAEQPHAGLLDRKREVVSPTEDELREVLGRPERLTYLHVVEDLEGWPRGVTTLRLAPHELHYAEATVIFAEEKDYAAPMADEALDFLQGLAFKRLKFNKIMVYSLNSEQGLKALLTRNGYRSNGVQREMVYTLGRWCDIETFSLFQGDYIGGRNGAQDEHVSSSS
jgi:RimJ/RimL family protein N-acetyltransferase